MGCKGSSTSTTGIPVDESLCTHCGKCCYKKLIIGRYVYITPFPCEFLDTDTNLCTIYEKRHELNPLCLSIEKGMKVSAFPEDCPYVPVHAPPTYKPAREDYDWSEDWQDFDGLADDLEASERTRNLVRERGPEAPPMHVEANARLEAARQANGGVLNLAEFLRDRQNLKTHSKSEAKESSASKKGARS